MPVRCSDCGRLKRRAGRCIACRRVHALQSGRIVVQARNEAEDKDLPTAEIERRLALWERRNKGKYRIDPWAQKQPMEWDI